MKPTADKPKTRQISIFEAAARAQFNVGIARGVQWGIWEAAWIAANSEEATGQDGGKFYRLPERDNRTYWQARWAAPFALDAEKLAHEKTLDELKAEQAALESARVRIGQLLDANHKAQDIKHQLDFIQNRVSKIDRQQLTRHHYDELNPTERKPRAKGAGAKRKYDLDRRQTAAVLDLAKKHGRTVPTKADAAAIIRKGPGDYDTPFTNPVSLLTSAMREAATPEVTAANYAHSAATMRTTTNRTAKNRAHKPRSPHVRGKLCGQPLHRALPRPNPHTSQGDGL